MKKNKKPLYKMVLNETKGLEFVSVVHDPAIEELAVTLSKEKEIKLTIKEEKRWLTGPFMIPDKVIERQDYQLVASAQDIEEIAVNFLKHQATNSINVEHKAGSDLGTSATIVESWFVGENDKSKDLGYDLPKGTWFGTVYFSDEKFWNEEVKTGNVRGFSIEGFVNLEEVKHSKQTIIKMAEAKTMDGVTIVAETWEPGAAIFVINENQEQVPAPDGVHTLEDGTAIEVKDGVIVTVTAAEVEQAEDPMVGIMSKLDEMSAKMNDSFTSLNDKYEELSKRMDKIDGDNKAVAEEMSAKLEKLSKLPGASSIVQNLNTTEPVKLSKEVKASAFEERIKSIRTKLN